MNNNLENNINLRLSILEAKVEILLAWHNKPVLKELASDVTDLLSLEAEEKEFENMVHSDFLAIVA